MKNTNTLEILCVTKNHHSDQGKGAHVQIESRYIVIRTILYLMFDMVVRGTLLHSRARVVIYE